jgi:hypothetical protein
VSADAERRGGDFAGKKAKKVVREAISKPSLKPAVPGGLP